VSDSPPEAGEAPEAGDGASDPRQGLADALRERLGDAVLACEVTADDLWVRVERSYWRAAVEACRTDLGMEYFCFLSGLDWKPAPGLSGEKVFEPAGAPADDDDDAPGSPGGAGPGDGQGPATGVAGGETRFQVFARLYSVERKLGLTLKADLDEDDPRVESITSIYRGAEWHEREAWEMYGFQFDGHPGLRHLYLPGQFEGHPLRKDFPLLAREVKPWPGLVDVEPMPGEPEVTEAAGDEVAAEAGGGA